MAGDFDGDGNLDIAGLVTGGWIWWYRGDGNGHFGSPYAYQASVTYLFEPVDLYPMDVDGDGRTELLVSGLGHRAVLLGALALEANAAASARPVPGPSAGGSECGYGGIAFGDVDGDGRADAVSVNGNIGSCPATIRTFRVRTDGGLQLEQASSILELPALADFDGDGRLDLAALAVDFGSRSISLSVQLGDGAGGFGSPALSPLPSLLDANRSLVAADFDGNGRSDIVFSGTHGQPPLLFLNECGHRPAGPGSPLSPRPRVRADRSTAP